MFLSCPISRFRIRKKGINRCQPTLQGYCETLPQGFSKCTQNKCELKFEDRCMGEGLLGQLTSHGPSRAGPHETPQSTDAPRPAPGGGREARHAAWPGMRLPQWEPGQRHAQELTGPVASVSSSCPAPAHLSSSPGSTLGKGASHVAWPTQPELQPPGRACDPGSSPCLGTTAPTCPACGPAEAFHGGLSGRGLAGGKIPRWACGGLRGGAPSGGVGTGSGQVTCVLQVVWPPDPAICCRPPLPEGTPV